ncbi:MAG TPA: ATP-grasp domain-containing protein, partial [Chitinophagales bacterium]|nr:ATP-grasp domain-containing protein [Chitinophagales bacterium]
MNVHEYQAKEIIRKHGVPVQEGIVAETVEEAVKAAEKLQAQTGTKVWVVKAQIHAGGRGKGGGVKVATSMDKLKEKAKDIIGMQLVTPQTGAQGKKVNKILIAQDVYDGEESQRHEYYVSILPDRTSKKNVIVYSTEGGM